MILLARQRTISSLGTKGICFVRVHCSCLNRRQCVPLFEAKLNPAGSRRLVNSSKGKFLVEKLSFRLLGCVSCIGNPSARR
jgi:hypothetical protein